MKYWFFLAFATISWGLNFHLAKIMMQYSTALEAGLWRYIFGVSVLLSFLWGDWPKWSAIKSQIRPLFLIGFIGLFCFNYAFFVGLSKTTAVNAALIAALNPATTLIFSHLILKTGINKSQIIGIVLALFGVVFLLLKGQLFTFMALEFNEGDAWIFLGNILFALHNVWVKQYGGKLSNRHFTFLTNFICLIGFVIIIPMAPIGAITSYPPVYWLATVGVGVMGTAIAYNFWNRGIAHVGVPQAGIFMNLVPFSAAVFALLFGEILQTYHIISGLIIISGIVIMQMKSWRNNN